MKRLLRVFGSCIFLSTAMLTSQISGAAEADETKPTSGLELGGYLDFYYQVSPQAHAPAPALAGPRIVEGRYFDRHSNQMTLNMAEVTLKKKVEKVSFLVSLGLGEMVDQLSGGGSQSVTATNSTNPAANEPTRNITQATISYAPTDRLSITAGKFYSFMGLEVTRAKDNWQYSRSYTYNYAIPFWHEGVSVGYALVPSKLSATAYLLNAWDGRISTKQNESTTVGFNLNFTGIDNLAANYNYIGGAESNDRSRREVHELNVVYKFTPRFSVATDYVLGSQKNIPALGDAKWSGLSLYAKASLTDAYSISPRIEFFDDSDKGFAIAGGLAAAGAPQKLTSYVLTNSFDLGHGLETRFELRADKSNSNQFFKSKDGGPSDHQESYTLALLYAF